MNLSFTTKIFSKNSDYVNELDNIFAARTIIDEAMSQIIPNISAYKRLSTHIQAVFEALEHHKEAS